MKQFKKTSLLTLVALAFVCGCAFGVARADTRDLRVISARAGAVNLVSGDVKVRREASADWIALSTQDELKSGDTVRTGSTGRVEVLLNPGSYFRAGGSTEFTLADTDLNNLRVELARGGAVVEAMGYDDNLSIGIVVPGSLVMIVRGGVYRIDVPVGGTPEVAVAKGRAVVANTTIKGGKIARLSSTGVEVAKLDKKWRDELDQWSRERGKELAKANEKLSHRALRSAFGPNGFDAAFGSWNGPSGFWFFNASLRCYTFLPLGYGWRSPYGYGYGTGIWQTPNQNGGWTPSYNPPTGGGDGSNNGGGGTWGGGSGNGGSNNGGGRDVTPMRPTPITPPSRVDPGDRPMRERTIEPGARPSQTHN